jgi:hypothetical protein
MPLTGLGMAMLLERLMWARQQAARPGRAVLPVPAARARRLPRPAQGKLAARNRPWNVPKP